MNANKARNITENAINNTLLKEELVDFVENYFAKTCAKAVEKASTVGKGATIVKTSFLTKLKLWVLSRNYNVTYDHVMSTFYWQLELTAKSENYSCHELYYTDGFCRSDQVGIKLFW